MPRQPERRNTAIKAHDDAHLSTATEATNRVQGLALLSLKRTFDLFMENLGQYVPLDEESQKLKLTCKVRDEYGQIQGFVSKTAATAKPAVSQPEVVSDMAKLIDSIPAEGTRHQEMNLENKEKQLIVQSEGKPGITAVAKEALSSTVMVPTATGGQKEYTPSATIARRAAAKWPRPQWRAPWKAYRVISGHQGWVRSVAFDPSNDWFATGSGDRTIKIWDVASGTLKLTLTGHIEQVTGLSISNRHPYMFSCALDKQVKCWDLEVNKVIRHYHGHLSGIYSIALHPTLDIIATGGRDATCRVWDMRTRTQIFALGGHEDTVAAILTQGTDPQIVTGSYDKTIKLWDLRAGKTMSTLTYHKKAVRCLAAHPTEHTFMSGAADNIKKFGLPNGEFLHNIFGSTEGHS